MDNQNSISVIGLGKLGMPLCAVLASKGFKVIGVDTNQEVVNLLNNGKSLLSEPRLQEFITRHKHSISATTNHSEAILSSDITFVIVPTPSDNHGYFSNAFLLNALRETGFALKQKSAYHLIVIVSTVMPGSMNAEIKKTIEHASQRIVGQNLGLCYSPEFIALGNVINNMLVPDMVLIGESDPQSGMMLEAIYKKICENNPPMIRMNLINAEITKLAVNTFVTTKISFANMLSDLCDKLPDADVNAITHAMGHDSRIGHKYLKAATSYGGPCFPRDNIAFVAMMEKLSSPSDIAHATHAINQYQIKRLLAMIASYGTSYKIGILGLSYKPDTSVVEESTGIHLANALMEKGYSVSVFDPMALHEAKKQLHPGVLMNESVLDCVSASDILVITTPWPEFREQLKPECVMRNSHPRIIIDCWRLLAKTEYADKVTLHYLGYGSHNHQYVNQKEELSTWKKTI